jgi:tetratricopeptide (TPR) repeat protein
MPLMPTLKPPTGPVSGDPSGALTKAIELHQAGKLQDAKALLEALMQSDTRRFDIMTLLGVVKVQLGEYEEALRILNLSLRLGPGQGDAHNLRGYCLFKLDRLDVAVESFNTALDLGVEAAHRNLATVLTNLGQFHDAIEHYNKALLADPADITIHHDRAVPLFALRRFDEALAGLDKLIAEQPGYAEAYFGKALILLTTGDYTNGWNLFEWRWRMAEAMPDQIKLRKRVLRKPLWLGDRVIEGKTILLQAEQGFGDSLQFCRFVPIVASLGAKVILEVPPGLKVLMESLDADIQVVTPADPLPPFDLYCPLMSLAKAIGLQQNKIPAPPFYLSANPERLAAWRARLGLRTRPRIGLVWFGSMIGGIANLKSMAFEDILSVTDCDADFFALQKQRTPGPGLAFQRSDSVTDLGDEIVDFADTAAIMTLLDLVITVDTGPAHLAGALGRPLWVMLQSQPEWRWPDGPTTPWYPSARLFRQTVAGDWNGPLMAVRDALPAWLSGIRAV